MPGVVMRSTGGPTTGHKYATIEPREHRRNGTRRWCVWVHYAGADAFTPWTSGGAGTLRLLQLLGASIPVLLIDGGTIPGTGIDNGQFTAGNAAVIASIADAFTWCVDPAKGGGKTDKVILGGSSQGTPGIVNYAKANPAKVAALWAVLPLSDLADVRDQNRPNGWTTTTTLVDFAVGGTVTAVPSTITCDSAAAFKTAGACKVNNDPVKLFDYTGTTATTFTSCTNSGGGGPWTYADNDPILGISQETPVAPNNVDSVNAAYGLATNSTGIWPTHGDSAAALPAGANPATDFAGAVGIPAKAWYSASDTTVPSATVTALWQTALAGTTAAITPDLGHVDGSLGNVVVADVLSFLLPFSR